MFLLFRNYLSLEIGVAIHFIGCFLSSLVEIDQVVLEKKMKMRKVYDNDNNIKQWKNFDQKNSLEPKLM